MEIVKYNTDNFDGVGREILLKEKDKILNISFAGNLDLYFSFSSKKDQSFEITKEDYYIYECFLRLYNDIKSNNLYKVDSFDLKDAKTEEEIEYIYEQNKEMNEYTKRHSHYDELFHNDMITWNSDDNDGYIKDVGTVTIKKENDKIILSFSDRVTSVRFRNSGSYYAPYNILFMEMFNRLMNYDKEDKQINIEEYLYEKTQEKYKKVRYV